MHAFPETYFLGIHPTHETRAIDFMISPHQHDNISKLLKMNTVERKSSFLHALPCSQQARYYVVHLVETMVEDAGFLIEQQRLQKEKSTLNKSVADMPYTGNIHQLTSNKVDRRASNDSKF